MCPTSPTRWIQFGMGQRRLFWVSEKRRLNFRLHNMQGIFIVLKRVFHSAVFLLCLQFIIKERVGKRIGVYRFQLSRLLCSLISYTVSRIFNQWPERSAKLLCFRFGCDIQNLTEIDHFLWNPFLQFVGFLITFMILFCGVRWQTMYYMDSR